MPVITVFAALILDFATKKEGKRIVVKRNHPVCFSFFFRGIRHSAPLCNNIFCNSPNTVQSNPLYLAVSLLSGKRDDFQDFAILLLSSLPALSFRESIGLSFNSGKGEEGSVDSTILYALCHKEKFSPGCLEELLLGDRRGSIPVEEFP